MSKASLELPRKPLCGWLVMAGYTKKDLKSNVRASSFLGFRSFFLPVSRARWLRHQPATLLCVCARGGIAVFPVGKTSGIRITPLRRENPLVSPKRNGVSPRALPSNHNGRPITHSVIARAKRAEKESEDQRIELARIPEIHSLFPIACPNKPTQNCLSG